MEPAASTELIPATETDSGSTPSGRSRTSPVPSRTIPAAAAAGPAFNGGAIRPEVHSQVSNSLNAPYQDMLSQFQQEDPTIARARHSMSIRNQNQPVQKPYPKAGKPQEPTAPAVEPPVPASRLSRRCLVPKDTRVPDLCLSNVIMRFYVMRF